MNVCVTSICVVVEVPHRDLLLQLQSCTALSFHSCGMGPPLLRAGTPLNNPAGSLYVGARSSGLLATLRAPLQPGPFTHVGQIRAHTRPADGTSSAMFAAGCVTARAMSAANDAHTSCSAAG